MRFSFQIIETGEQVFTEAGTIFASLTSFELNIEIEEWFDITYSSMRPVLFPRYKYPSQLELKSIYEIRTLR